MDRKTLVLTGELDFSEEAGIKEAFSAISLNPSFQWAKIVVLDNLPNANKMRIPDDEFDNILKTGINTPIKMADSEVMKGHKNALGKPIGVIAQLTRENNRIIALAALWTKERPEEVSALKDSFLKGNPPQVSWEISYLESTFSEEGIEDLHSTALDGLAIVSIPAYLGRTPFVAMSSESITEFISQLDEIITSEDISEDNIKLIEEKLQTFAEKFSNKESVNLEELELLKAKVAELEGMLKTANDKITTLETENTGLAEYKTQAETAKAEAEKFDKIKSRFAEAKLEKDEEYFNTNKELLLGLGDPQLDFMIQEMVAFKTASAELEDGTDVKIPNLSPKKDFKGGTPKELAQALRSLKK